jgi:hypothetical protein
MIKNAFTLRARLQYGVSRSSHGDLERGGFAVISKKKGSGKKARGPKGRKDTLQLLLIDFCNVRTWSPVALRVLYERYRIAHDREEGLGDRGFVGSFCITREDPKRRRFPLGPEGMRQHGRLWEFLDASQGRYRAFLDGCVNGSINAVFLNRCLKQTQVDDYLGQPNPPPVGSLFSFVEGYLKEGRQWKLKLQLVHGVDAFRPTLETALDGEIINLFLSGQGDVFERIGKCPHCGNYFVKERKDKKHCNEKCRRDCNNEKAIKTGSLKEYLKKHRVKGVYVKVKDRDMG